jgi:hypothetical protein
MTPRIAPASSPAGTGLRSCLTQLPVERVQATPLGEDVVARRLQKLRVAGGLRFPCSILPEAQSSLFLRPALTALADPKYVAVRVAQVHLPDVPRHIGRWESNVQPGGHALRVDLVNIFYPHRHPDAFVGGFVSDGSKGGGIRASASASLTSLTEKDFAFAGPDCSESRRSSPIPTLPPAPLLKPSEARGDVGYVQYRGKGFGIHGAEE